MLRPAHSSASDLHANIYSLYLTLNASCWNLLCRHSKALCTQWQAIMTKELECMGYHMAYILDK